jgi:hypothetical protein
MAKKLQQFFWSFFSVAFLGKGSFKTTLCKKPVSKTFYQKKRQDFQCQIFLDLSLFYRVVGCFSARIVQKLYKNILQKVSVHAQKPLQKFSLDFFNHIVLGVSRRGEFENTTKKTENILRRVTFLASGLLTYPRGSPIVSAVSGWRWRWRPVVRTGPRVFRAAPL